MGRLRFTPLILACALPLAAAAQEVDQIDPSPEGVTADIEDLKVNERPVRPRADSRLAG